MQNLFLKGWNLTVYFIYSKSNMLKNMLKGESHHSSEKSLSY